MGFLNLLIWINFDLFVFQKRIIDLEKELEVEIQNRMHAEEAAVRARQNTQITPTSQQVVLYNQCIVIKKNCAHIYSFLYIALKIG